MPVRRWRLYESQGGSFVPALPGQAWFTGEMVGDGRAADGARRPKVFCIGLNKTGTTSLHEALVALGYRSLHWGGPETPPSVARAVRERVPLLTYLGDYEAFSDIQSLVLMFDRLDAEYPGSRFIFTTRDRDSWLRSRAHHVERNIVRHAKGEYTGTFLTVDHEGWMDLFRNHEERVRAHFADRPDDLLVMDIPGGDGYEPLCSFLGLPQPSDPFPWRQRGATPLPSAGLVEQKVTTRAADWLSQAKRMTSVWKPISSRRSRRSRPNSL